MLCVGPMCRYAVDLKLMLKVLAAGKSDNVLHLSQPVNLQKLRLFYMETLNSLLVENTHQDVVKALKKTVKYFEKKHDITSYRVDLPLAHYALPYWPQKPHDVNCFAELGKWFFCQSDHTLPAIFLGLVSHRTQIRGQTRQYIESKRDQLRREVIDLLREDGILVFPSFATAPPFHNQPIFTPLNFSYTALWNALALPSIVCPVGLNEDGVPLSVQLVGAPHSDSLLIAAAYELEQGFGGWTPPGQ
uniref:Amidase domain-containing protein n=1 Tax=Acrobeloides nanus TaxID=290746 RepID=A0A914EG93_9BILA